MLLPVLAVLAASTPAAGSAGATASPPTPAAAAKKPDLICKTEEVTGSMFPKKVCRPREQAERDRAETQEQIRESQRVTTGFRH